MPPTSHSSQHVLVIGVIAVCVLAGSSYAAYQYGYGRGASARALSTQVVPIPVRTVLGTVVKISGQQITLGHFTRVPSLAGAATSSATMTITIDQSTRIERYTLNNPSVIKVQTATTTLTDPSYATQTITLSDIKVGDTITAFSSSDISTETAFTATEIDLQASPTAVKEP